MGVKELLEETWARWGRLRGGRHLSFERKNTIVSKQVVSKELHLVPADDDGCPPKKTLEFSKSNSMRREPSFCYNYNQYSVCKFNQLHRACLRCTIPFSSSSSSSSAAKAAVWMLSAYCVHLLQSDAPTVLWFATRTQCISPDYLCRKTLNNFPFFLGGECHLVLL
jgi:hypothetical protein